jgi:hypothetical protein
MGLLNIERDDLWGEKAKIYFDGRPLIKRLSDDLDWNDVLTFLLMPHMSIILLITRNISKNATKFLFFSILFSLIFFGSTYGTNLHLTYIEQIWFSLLVLYLLIPIIIFGTDALSSDDD